VSDRGEELAGRTTFAVLLVLAAAFAWRTLADIDVGLHLAGGRYLFEHGAVPRMDPFTWTVGDHAYVAYHWLFQALLYGTDRIAGATGMVVLRTLLVGAAVVGLADVLRTRGVSPMNAAWLGVLGLLAVEWRFSLRPELLSWVFAAAMLAVLERHRAGRTAPLWLLPLLQCLWANSHIHAFGLVLVGVYAGAEALRARSLRTPLLGWGLACVLATLFNPYGLEGALVPLQLATRLSSASVFAESIVELASPFALAPDPDHPITTSTSLLAYKLLFLAALVAFGLQLWRRRFEDVALLLLFGGLSTLAIRNLPMFVVTCLPALCSALELGKGRRAPIAWGAAVVASGVLLYGVVFGNYYAAERRPQRFGAELCAPCLALGTADFVARSGLEGHGFNNLAMGSVLMWRDPERKVFIDGRNEVSREDFFREYQQALDPARWAQTQRRYALEYVVLAHRGDGRASDWMARLHADPDWRLVHLGGAGFVYVRSAGPNGGLPEVSLPTPVSRAARATALAAVHVQGNAFTRWFAPTRAPLAATHGLGNLLARAGFPEAAESLLLDAVQRHPDDFEPHLDLGLVYRTLGLDAEALRSFEHALALAPDHPGLAALRDARAAR
jgi:hypothetical protein